MEVNFKYLGTFKNNGNEYVVAQDTTNNIINIYFNSVMYGDVECFSIHKEYIDIFKGKSLLTKTKNCWRDFDNHSMDYIEKHTFLQTFPKGFWNDVIVPMMNGEEYGRIEAMEIK